MHSKHEGVASVCALHFVYHNVRMDQSESNGTKTELVDGYHWIGEFGKALRDSSGRVIATSVPAKKFTTNAECYYAFMVRISDTKHQCLICGEVKAATDNKPSNMITHIKIKHHDMLGVVCYEHLPESIKRETCERWKTLKAGAPTDPPKRKLELTQQTIPSTMPKSRPVKEQCKALMEACCLGAFESTTNPLVNYNHVDYF